LFKAQLIDKEVEIQMLKDQVVQMYAKMSFLEAENDSLRKRVVSLEQLQHTPAPGKSASSISEDGPGSGSGSSPEKARDRIVALESEVRQLREQNMQLKSTLKSVLSAT
jgi:regulator of replication initiation timing